MNETFNLGWTEQLREAAQQVADQAEDIVGNLQGNISLRVIITVRTDTEKFGWPKLEIEREIIPAGAILAKIRHHQPGTQD